MPFRDIREAESRLSTPAPLTDEEVRDLLPWARNLSTSTRERLQAELSVIHLAALQRQEKLVTRQLESFDRFDQATTKANRLMIGFTAAVTFMTLVMLLLALYPLLRR